MFAVQYGEYFGFFESETVSFLFLFFS